MQSGWSSWRTDAQTGGDEAKKLEFRRALVWNHGHRNKTFEAQPGGNMRQNAGKEAVGRPTTVKRWTKTCLEYNAGKCIAQAEHPTHLHICSYCLSAAGRQCAHQERFGHRQIYDEASENDKAIKKLLQGGSSHANNPHNLMMNMNSNRIVHLDIKQASSLKEPPEKFLSPCGCGYLEKMGSHSPKMSVATLPHDGSKFICRVGSSQTSHGSNSPQLMPWR